MDQLGHGLDRDMELRLRAVDLAQPDDPGGPQRQFMDASRARCRAALGLALHRGGHRASVEAMEPPSPANCPRCRREQLDEQRPIRHCGRCKGSWIPEEVLHDRVAAMRTGRLGGRLAWRTEARAALMCPACGMAMETLVVFATPIDRCAAHGVWFDANELAHVLMRASVVRPSGAADSGSIAAVVISETPELAGEVVVSAVAGETAEVGAGVFEVVIDGVGVIGEVVVDAVAGILSAIVD